MNFENFWSNLSSQDSIAILFITIIAFLLGLIVGLLLNGGKLRKIRKELAATKKKLSDSEAALSTANGELANKTVALEKSQSEMRVLVDKLSLTETEKEKAYKDVLALNDTVEQLQANNKAYLHNIDELNEHIETLKNENETLVRNAASAYASASNSSNSVSEDQLKALENRINELENRLGEQSTPPSAGAVVKNSNSMEFDHADEPTIDEIMTQEKDALKIIPEDKSALDKDDLTMIEGIGTFIEQKLNEIDIYNYEQISRLTPAEIERITQQIGYFPGRIQKDDWVGQAYSLMTDKQNKKGRVTAKALKAVDNTDLKIVEGIGPKIEQILKDAGISNWVRLATTPTTDIKMILEAAGSRYKMHNPATWSKQAALAADGQWDELKAYQEELKGGRE